jgi:hypothetical protein
MTNTNNALPSHDLFAAFSSGDLRGELTRRHEKRPLDARDMGAAGWSLTTYADHTIKAELVRRVFGEKAA